MHPWEVSWEGWSLDWVGLVAPSWSQTIDLIKAIAWPAVVLIAIFAALSDRGRRLLRPVLRRIRKVSGPGGWGLELSEEAAAATKRDVEGAIHEYAKVLKDEFERLAYQEDVRPRMIAAAKGTLTPEELKHASARAQDVRATVHVKDALYTDALYQLVDYWPGGGGSGRRFSIRYGILGRAWRLGASEYERNVTTQATKLIREWGMTEEQAMKATRERKTCIAAVLRHDEALVGVLYIDAITKDALPENLKARLDASTALSELAEAVDRVRQGIASRGPGLKLLESD